MHAPQHGGAGSWKEMMQKAGPGKKRGPQKATTDDVSGGSCCAGPGRAGHGIAMMAMAMAPGAWPRRVPCSRSPSTMLCSVALAASIECLIQIVA